MTHLALFPRNLRFVLIVFHSSGMSFECQNVTVVFSWQHIYTVKCAVTEDRKGTGIEGKTSARSRTHIQISIHIYIIVEVVYKGKYLIVVRTVFVVSWKYYQSNEIRRRFVRGGGPHCYARFFFLHALRI